MAEDKLDKIKEKKENIDVNKVNNIVVKMRKKSQKQGTGSNVVEGHLKELRDVISKGKLSNLDVNPEATLSSNANSDLEKKISKLYKPFKKIIDKIVMYMAKHSLGKKISYYITSANMKRTLVQHLVLSVLFSLLISGFFSVLFIFILSALKPLFLIAVPFLFIGMFLISLFAISYLLPMKKAKDRGVLIDVDLPFALRHLSTELQAGIGLYKVLESIAKNDYGVLSEEISRTVMEIENGTDTKTALRHASLRSQSKSFNIALFHIIRTLNTGGNLASTIDGVADTVSFDLLEAQKTFGEKMNFFGIIFIFVAIVLPVFASILGAIANAPLGQDGSLFLPGVMTPSTIKLIFLVGLPIIFVFLIYYIKMIEPKM